ncbi:hypothetical protein PFMALIP_00914 [Plasmodium falciparum MaliPS096_E11]|uniref:Surface antigen n=1 Tax=Plasmodium falciparum MaliPS096_E11 TaxID=1036727 RepID=A0A024WWW8_PLAFA|nr:hypothetical protein PFMALIP_00914 [Plasmodium falciparum MaliPS096_E11]
MKVHYINILLFSLPLNILAHNKNKPSITPHHTPKIPTTRLLCECELYSPANYDNDTQMKSVIDNFNKQTQQRLEKYDNRMIEKRKHCKDKCDKEIQKIILKDKIEKELTEKFATLQTDIQNDAIPTCVCEKSLADKVEKNYMKCTQNLGGIVAPSSGVLAGIAEGAVIVWKDAEIVAAIAAAKEAGAVAGKAAGDIAGAAEVVQLIESKFSIKQLGTQTLQSVFTKQNYTNVSFISRSIHSEYSRLGCGQIFSSSFRSNPFCTSVREGMVATTRVGTGGSPEDFIKTTVETIVKNAKNAADAKAADVAAAKTPVLEARNIAAVNTTYAGYHTIIIASTVAIVVIVLIMVIIYLILRYRRKKKMKKKLQYIKLLKE